MLIAMPYYFFPSTVPHAVCLLYRLPGSGPPCYIPLLPYGPFASVTAPVQRSGRGRSVQALPGAQHHFLLLQRLPPGELQCSVGFGVGITL